MGDPPALLRLPQAAPQPILALGAFLKNTACWLQGDEARFSALHGDLADPRACETLVASAQALVDAAGRRPAAVAHDLHPDFFSTRHAQRLASHWGVPAVAVQHHRAHIAAVQAEQGLGGAVIGIALDGVGLGLDAQAWGGEVLWLDRADALRRAGDSLTAAPSGWRRCAHLAALPMPGGDRAAREPWRLAAALLHGLGRGDEIVPRFAAVAGDAAAALLRQQLERGFNTPLTTAAGRWFDAAAAALGVHLGHQEEAQAAIALQAGAERWVSEHGLPAPGTGRFGLDLGPLLAGFFDLGKAAEAERAAAVFHVELAAALADAALAAARTHGVDTVAFGGGCFHNALLERCLIRPLHGAGLRCLRPQQLSCGDAGIALGQAWVASWLAAAQD